MPATVVVIRWAAVDSNRGMPSVRDLQQSGWRVVWRNDWYGTYLMELTTEGDETHGPRRPTDL